MLIPPLSCMQLRLTVREVTPHPATLHADNVNNTTRQPLLSSIPSSWPANEILAAKKAIWRYDSLHFYVYTEETET